MTDNEDFEALKPNPIEKEIAAKSLELRENEPPQPVLTEASLQLWTDANKEKLKSWFDVSNNFKVSNELYTDYAYYILEKNFAKSNLELKRGFHEKNLNWYSFCWYFYRHTWSFVSADEHKQMMRDIFADLADFCDLVYGNKVGRYAVLLNEFLVEFKLPEQIVNLLPEKILEKMPELETQFGYWLEARYEHENEMIRLGMMGY
jgi:hypothetical protein